MDCTDKNCGHPEAPRPLKLDIKEIPDLKTGDAVSLRKVDPKTGRYIVQSVNLTGTLAHSIGNMDGVIADGRSISVSTPEYDAIKSNLSADHFAYPPVTSPVDHIDFMSNGKYWIQTRSGSTYELTIEDLQADENKDTSCGLKDGAIRRAIKKLFGKK